MNIAEAEQKRDPTSDFHLVEKLGDGSYGSVWKSVHIKTGTVTAIKRVPVENDLDEILNEIKIMKQCRSPYIISYYGSYFKDNELWIVMEFCGGGSVSDLMRILDKTLTEDQIAVVVRDALKGLNYLHGIKKIHRDIKAGNILLNGKGESKLADFGVSGQLSDTMAKRQTVIGTPFWMAPEVIQEVGYDVRADIWSLGITVIEIAEGKPPYSNIHPMRAIFMIPSRPPPKFSDPDKWSKDLNDFLSKCLTKNADQRPTAEELLKHPFIQKAKKPDVLVPFIEDAEAIIARIGREEAIGLNDEDEESEEDSGESEPTGTTKSSSSTNSANSGTSKINKPKKETESSEGFGTMVKNDEEESGTMKVGKKKPQRDYVPQFLQQYKKEDGANNNDIAKKNDVQPNPKWANLTPDELKKRLKDMETSMDKEIEAIKSKYASQKKDIETLIAKKKQK